MRPDFHNTPLLLPVVSLATGIAATRFFDWRICAVALIIIAVACLISRQRLAAILTLCGVLGTVTTALNTPRAVPPRAALDRAMWMTAVIDNAAEHDGYINIDCHLIHCDSARIERPFPAVRITYLSVEHDFHPADTVTFHTTLTEAVSHTVVPGQNDYAAILRQRGIYAHGIVTPDTPVAVKTGHGLKRDLHDLRMKLRRQLFGISLDSGTLEFLDAVLLGDSSAIDDSTRREFADAGIAHMLALSGLHIAILAWILSLLLYPLTLAGHHHARDIVIILSLWAFAIATGFSVSVARAVLMATFVLGGKLLQRPAPPLNSLCAAALLILVLDPQALFAIGFQLSFSAVATIIVVSGPLNRVHPRHKGTRAIASYVIASTGAIASAGLISAIYFHRFPVFFLIGNIVSVTLLPVLLGLGIAVLAASATGAVPEWLCIVTDAVYTLMQRFTSIVTSMPGAVIDDIYLPWWTIPAAAAIVWFIAEWGHKRRTVYPCAAGMLLAATVACVAITRPSFPRHECFFIPDKRHTHLLIHDGDSLYIVTTAPRIEHQAVIHNAVRDYDDFRGMRQLDHFSIAPDTVAGRYFRRSGDILEINGHRLAIVSDNNHRLNSTMHISTIIVARGFTGDIVGLATSIRPDSLLLSSDLNPRRSRRYLDECREADVNVATTFNLTNR